MQEAALRRGFFVEGAAGSEIRGDALGLPVAITGRFRTLRALELLRRRFGLRRGSLPAHLGFGERALRRRRQLLAWSSRRGGRGQCGIVGHLSVSRRNFQAWEQLTPFSPH